MTEATKDIAALMRDMRDLADRIVECQDENSNGDEIINLYDQSDATFKAQNILLVLNEFEAQRQKATETNNINLNIKLSLHERVVKAEKEIAALKGKQQPVGEIVAWSGTDIEKGITREVDFRFLRFDVQPGQQLFTAQQKPVVHPDTKRMDWLCSHVVEVREPLFYGSHSMFWSQCDSDDCEEHHTTLREQVDAAIEAAGRIVKDGKLLALRQGDNMKEKCLTCGREMSDEPDSLNLSCGGDCLECMASHGDPNCISAVTRIKARKRDAGSNGTEA